MVVESHDDFPGVEISIAGGVGEMVREDINYRPLVFIDQIDYFYHYNCFLAWDSCPNIFCSIDFIKKIHKVGTYEQKYEFDPYTSWGIGGVGGQIIKLLMIYGVIRIEEAIYW